MVLHLIVSVMAPNPSLWKVKKSQNSEPLNACACMLLSKEGVRWHENLLNDTYDVSIKR